MEKWRIIRPTKLANWCVLIYEKEREIIKVFGKNDVEANNIADLVVNAPQTKQQRDNLLKACKAMVTDFDLGEPSIKESLLKMRQTIAECEAK